MSVTERFSSSKAVQNKSSFRIVQKMVLEILDKKTQIIINILQ